MPPTTKPPISVGFARRLSSPGSRDGRDRARRAAESAGPWGPGIRRAAAWGRRRRSGSWSRDRGRRRCRRPRRCSAISCVTMTMVAPRLSRSSRIRSSSSRELIGSSPAEGSSNSSTSGDSAIARARPARFCMPPLICEGKYSSKPASPTSARFSEARSAISAGSRSVYCSSGSATFSSKVIELHSPPAW